MLDLNAMKVLDKNLEVKGITVNASYKGVEYSVESNADLEILRCPEKDICYQISSGMPADVLTQFMMSSVAQVLSRIEMDVTCRDYDLPKEDIKLCGHLMFDDVVEEIRNRLVMGLSAKLVSGDIVYDGECIHFPVTSIVWANPVFAYVVDLYFRGFGVYCRVDGGEIKQLPISACDTVEDVKDRLAYHLGNMCAEIEGEYGDQ